MTAVTDDQPAVAGATLVAFVAALLLAGIAVYNYSTGVYGGAIVSAVGATVATLLGLLTD